MLKIINKSDNRIFYATPQSAAFDIAANEHGMLQPGQRKLISTGLYLTAEQPIDKIDVMLHGLSVQWTPECRFFPELQIRPRSGLALKHGVTILNSPGTVDLDYRDPNEIKVLLFNAGGEPWHYTFGDRIAQGAVALVSRAIGDVEVQYTQRTGGFGSTGVK
jgi:dUTP pyrophosphatase